MRETKIEGRIWVITDSKGRIIDDIDTDQIYHNSHLAVTAIEEMGKYTFGNLEGWREFPDKVRSGDIIIVGKNFGSGSSRQHAVDCFRALGIKLIIGQSFGAIYKRNAINSGFAVLECPQLESAGLKSGDSVIVDVAKGEIIQQEGREEVIKAEPFSSVQMDIYKAGDLFKYAKMRQQE